MSHILLITPAYQTYLLAGELPPPVTDTSTPYLLGLLTDRPHTVTARSALLTSVNISAPPVNIPVDKPR